MEIALDSNRKIGIAVGIFMQKHRLNHIEAFEALRREARNQRYKLSTIADVVINYENELNHSEPVTAIRP